MMKRILFELMRREALPTWALLRLTQNGLSDWYRWLERGLAEATSQTEARRLLQTGAASAFARRHTLLEETGRLAILGQPGPSQAEFLTALYGSRATARIGWIFNGPSNGLTTRRLRHAMTTKDQWHELTTHLGEVLVSLTQELPRIGTERPPVLLGRICRSAGIRYGQMAKTSFGLPDTVASAVTVLRLGEYVFRVNPVHHSEADAESGRGMIEGNACPWYTEPGWTGMHCGIFGQFQAGISQAFGLSYRLAQTIPKHGGDTCRIDLVPIREPHR